MNSIMRNYTQKVNTVITVLFMIILIAVGVTILLGTSVLSFGQLGFLIGIIISSVFVHKKIYQKETSYILMLSGVILIGPVIFSDTASADAALQIIIALCFAVVYFNKILLLIYSFLFYSMVLIAQFTVHNFSNEAFISAIVYVGVISAILFFACKWGESLITTSIQKEAYANELLNSLNKVMNAVQDNTVSLNDDITNCYKNTGTLKDISNFMSIT